MAISFTNEQVASMSKAVLTLPGEITAAKDAQSGQAAGVVDLKKKDDTNKVFYDNYLNIVTRYHDELKAINGTSKTTYLTSDLEEGGKQSQGNLHFPMSPVWMNFPPKILDSNNGNPSSSVSGHEGSASTDLSNEMNIFTSGFTDGSSNTTTTTPYSSVSGVTLTSAAGVAIGQRAILYTGSSSMYGTIASVSGTNITFNEIIPPATTITSGATFKNFFTGFTNTERESGTASLQNVFNGMKSRINNFISLYSGYLTQEQTALNANDASQPDKPEIDAAKVNVAAILSTISTWQANPETGAGVAKWGDTKIVPFKAAVTARISVASIRVNEITLRLGNVAQAGDGSFSGKGNYQKLFDWINMRINKVSGTLTQYYLSGLGGTAMGQQVSGLEKQLKEYSDIFAVTKMTADGNGSDEITVDNVAQFVVNDSVMVIDDDTAFVERTILSINGKSVKLNGVISSEFKVDTYARLVKRK